MPLQLIIPPSVEPVSVSEARSHVRQDITDDDSILLAQLMAARAAAETKTQRQIVVSRWKLVLDSFPSPSLIGIPIGTPFSLPLHAILLPKAPVRRVVSIDYLGMDGVWHTMPPSDYVADIACEPARITPVFGAIWPIPLPQIGSVVVTFDAGCIAPAVFDQNSGSVSVPMWPALSVGDAVQFCNAGGALPAPLKPGATYYVAAVDGQGACTLSATSGGNPITLTDPGSGQPFVGVMPDGMRAWILLLLGALYENRELSLVLNRGKIEDLPFVDGLLDPYRMVLA